MGSRGDGFLSLVVANGAISNRIFIPQEASGKGGGWKGLAQALSPLFPMGQGQELRLDRR